MRRSGRAKQHVTIHDIARVATVSPTTVSNVLNGRTDTMTPETLRRVQQAIRDLNYRPNNAARVLVTQRTATIGLILAEIETPLFLQSLNRIEPVAREAGYNILLCIARNTEDEQHALAVLLEKQVDGIIFLSTSQYLADDHLLELQRIGLPTVLVNRASLHDDFDQINWDNASGIDQAVEYLIGLGHQPIAHLRGPDKRRSAADRLDGYRRALERHGLVYREDYVVPGDFTAPQETWKKSTFELLERSPRPTAIIASDDVVAATVIQTIHSVGLRIPQDVAVVGCDDQPFCTYLNPPLTTVKLPVTEAGELAVKMLLDRIAGNRTDVEHITLPCTLVARESTGGKA